MLQIYFIRHGQSTNNAMMEEADREDYLTGRDTDPDLTPIGEIQARLVADYLARPPGDSGFDPQNREGFGLTHLYCSLMIRAIKTGSAIAQKTGLPLVARQDVHETGGIFSVEMLDQEPVFIGKPGPEKSYFTTEFPDLILPEGLSEGGWWNCEKENREDSQARAHAIIEWLKAEHAGKDHRVGIVMHGGIFTRIMSAFFDIQVKNYWFLMNNCGISRVDLDDDGHLMLAYINKVDHMPDDLIT